MSSSSFCVFKIKFFCAIPCKLKKNNLYLRLGKNNLNVHAYEDNVDFTNFSPLDIKNATFGSQGRRMPMEQRNADAKAKQELETLQQTWGTMK